MSAFTSALCPSARTDSVRCHALGVGQLDRIEQAAGATTVPGPLRCGGVERAAPLLVDTVDLDPAREGRPGRDQDLVCQVDAWLASVVIIIGGEQPVVNHPL